MKKLIVSYWTNILPSREIVEFWSKFKQNDKTSVRRLEMCCVGDVCVWCEWMWIEWIWAKRKTKEVILSIPKNNNFPNRSRFNVPLIETDGSVFSFSLQNLYFAEGVIFDKELSPFRTAAITLISLSCEMWSRYARYPPIDSFTRGDSSQLPYSP